MKAQSPLFLPSPDRTRSPFLWAVALRIRQQSLRRPGSEGIGPVPDSVVEWTPRRADDNERQ